MSDSNCQIERRGIVKRCDDNKAVIEIEGKEIPVPKEKLAPNVMPGNQVRWVGNHWIRTT